MGINTCSFWPPKSVRIRTPNRQHLLHLQGNSLDSETRSHTAAPDSVSARRAVHVYAIHMPYLSSFFPDFYVQNCTFFRAEERPPAHRAQDSQSAMIVRFTNGEE